MKTKAELINDFIEAVTDDEAISCIEKDGGVSPAFVFHFVKDEAVHNAVLPIPLEIMDKGRAGKEFFMKEIFPKVKEEIKSKCDEIIAIAFISEVWKSADKDLMHQENELNESNSEECVMMTFHYEGHSLNFIYPMLKIGGKLKLGKAEVMTNEYGKSDFVGRFSEIF